MINIKLVINKRTISVKHPGYRLYISGVNSGINDDFNWPITDSIKTELTILKNYFLNKTYTLKPTI